jgi:hypothetical protein
LQGRRGEARWADCREAGRWREQFQSIADRLEMVAPGYNADLRGVPIKLLRIVVEDGEEALLN